MKKKTKCEKQREKNYKNEKKKNLKQMMASITTIDVIVLNTTKNLIYIKIYE